MTTSILGEKLQAKFDSAKQLLTRVASLTQRCRENDLGAIIIERLRTLDAAALLVIVGEVKAGKSSFINALLGDAICVVAPDPCTAVIQEMVYGPDPQRITLGPDWERVFIESEVLRSVSIVDTPGTNSILKNHEAITEQYIPQSDLVVFVFAAKNPHTNSSWEFLALVRKDWHRKTVFVLQQADLTTRNEQDVNVERVKQYARKRGVQDPIVFAVSATREVAGAADSGFPEFREFLQATTVSGDVFRIKLEGVKEVVRKVVGQIADKLNGKNAGLAVDKAFLQTLRDKILARRRKAVALRRLVVDSLCRTYDRLADGLKSDFSSGLEVGTVFRRSIPFVRDQSFKQWLADLEQRFKKMSEAEIATEANRVSKDLCNEIEGMFEELSLCIEAHKSDISACGLSAAQDRADIFEGLRRKLEELRLSDVISDKVLGGSVLGQCTLVGGGVAALGTVIALATNLVVLDITGGILTATGVLIVAVTLLWKRKAIQSEFDQKIEASKQTFRDKLNAEIEQLFERIFLELEHRLSEPAEKIEHETIEISALLTDAKACEALAVELGAA